MQSPLTAFSQQHRVCRAGGENSLISTSRKSQTREPEKSRCQLIAAAIETVSTAPLAMSRRRSNSRPLVAGYLSREEFDGRIEHLRGPYEANAQAQYAALEQIDPQENGRHDHSNRHRHMNGKAALIADRRPHAPKRWRISRARNGTLDSVARRHGQRLGFDKASGDIGGKADSAEAPKPRGS